MSCGKKNGNGTDDVWVAPEKSDTIAYSSVQDIKDTLIVDGNVYNYKLHREPTDSMPIVTSFSEQRYKDNVVDLTISNDKEGIILKKHFNKNSFSDFVPSDKLKVLSLVDMYCYYAKPDKKSKLYFMAKIGDPEDNDENFYYVEVQISPSGELHMQKAKMEELFTQSLGNIESDDESEENEE